MSYIKNLHVKWFFGVAIFAIAFFGLIPCAAMADVSYPGSDESSNTGTTAETQVGLKLDQESQLSFTAPTVVNFALNSDGTFQVPTGAYFKNDSVFDIKVVSYAVTSKSGATGVEDVTGKSSADTYQINVKGTSGDAVPFAINSASDWAGWTLGAKSSTTDTCTLTFSNGKMINPTGSIWKNGAPLQEVVWTVSAV